MRRFETIASGSGRRLRGLVYPLADTSLKRDFLLKAAIAPG